MLPVTNEKLLFYHQAIFLLIFCKDVSGSDPLLSPLFLLADPPKRVGSIGVMQDLTLLIQA